MSKTVKIKPAGSCWCWWADCVNTWGGATSITRSGTLRRPFVVVLQRCFYNLLIYLVLNKTHSVSFHPDHLFFSSMNFMNDKLLLQNNKIFKFCASHIICFSWCYSTHLEEELQISDEFIVVFNKLTLR